MTAPEKVDLRKLRDSLIARGARSGRDAAATTAAARDALEDLAVVLVPLVSQTGFDAMVARACQLAEREYPLDGPPGGQGEGAESFVQVDLWLDRQNPGNSIDAAAAMFAQLAALLTTLIGESLTSRYLHKAWPDGFSPGT